MACGQYGSERSLAFDPVPIEEMVISRHVLVGAFCSVSAFVCCPPVRHDPSVEAHPFAEVSLEEIRVAAGVAPVDLVVRAHNGDGARLDSRDKGRVVALPRGTLRNHHILRVSIVLLLVECIVLDDGTDARALHAAHVGADKRHTQVRILARDVFEIAAAVRDAVHIYGGAQDDIGPLAPTRQMGGGGGVLDEDTWRETGCDKWQKMGRD